MDLLPTLATIAGAAQPELPIDGRDIGPILRGEPGASSPHEVFCYYARGRLEAIRDHRYKRVFANALVTPPIGEALYDLVADPSESVDVSADHPDVVSKLENRADSVRSELGDVLNQVEGSATRSLALAP